MSGVPEASVVVCTRNRGGRVGATVASVARSIGQAREATEIVLVDNSTVEDDALQELAHGSVTLRVVREPIAGLARARNTGVVAARGRAILFTDDDVVVPPNWVEAMTTPLLSGSADAVAGGIRMDASLERPWMSDWLRQQFAHVPTPRAEGPFMIGANMGATRDVLTAVRFNEDLGAPPYQRGEDAFFWEQLVRRGACIRGVADAVVLHQFDERRLEPDALRALARTMGRCEAYLWHHQALGDLGSYRARATWHAARAALARARRSPSPDAEMRALAKLEFNREMLRLRRVPPKFPLAGTRA